METGMDLQNMSKHVAELLKACGEDPDREGLKRTPERYLKSLAFFTSGYSMDPKKIAAQGLFHNPVDDMILVRNVEFYSLCEHHMVPFYGVAHIGYIPNEKIIGLSKIPRVIDVFARRFQVQERMTRQISEALEEVLAPKGVGVVVKAYHLCMMMRGVQKQNSFTVTSSMLGCFRDLKTREEFLSHINSSGPM